MEEDRLRIPSTKRICFVGRKFSLSEKVRKNFGSGMNSGFSGHFGVLKIPLVLGLALIEVERLTYFFGRMRVSRNKS